MLNRSSNAVKSWVVVGVGSLVLALSAFFILSNFSPDSTYAQMVPDPITYNENGDGPVITLTSMDPESRGIDWFLMGTDAADFTISGGVLEFKNPPDFENPTDRAHTAVDIDGNGETTDPGEAQSDAIDNMYRIVIMVTERRQAGDMGVAKYTKIGATVSVMEQNEQGTITLDALQPEVRTPARTITATLADEDDPRATVTWQWARSKVQQPSITSSAHWEVIDGAGNETYGPVAADEGKFLRVMATYDDTAGNSANTVREVTKYRVRDMPSNNGSPDFPAEMHTRSVAETAAVGTAVGAPVTASEPDSADQGKLIYGLVEDTDNSNDDDYFSIDQYTGQIRVAAGLDADERWHTATVPGSTTDRETGSGDAALGKGEYRVVATVGDPSAPAGTPDDTVIVTITATQQNENPWVIWEGNDTNENDTEITGLTEISIQENTNIAATNVYGADDNDANPNINWVLEGDDKDLFSPPSGTDNRTLTFASAPDYEMPEDMNGDNVYKVTLVVTDGQGGRGMLPVSVTVMDVTEVDKAKVTLSSEQPHLDTPLTAELMAPDGDVTIIGWQWYRAETSAAFALTTDPRTGVVEIPGATSDTYTPTAHDNGIGNFLEVQVTFIYKHTASDITALAGMSVPATPTDPDTDPAGTRMAAVVSENAIQAAPGTSTDPAFPSSTLTREVQENAEALDRVGAPVLAVDADSNDVLTYELDGRDRRFFEFEEDSPGQIIISDGMVTGKDEPTLDREDSNGRRFIVTVKATDSESNDAIATVNIVVTDVNEAPEFMDSPTEAVTFREDGMGIVTTLRATDPEGRGGGVDWEVLGTDGGNFTISGGALRFKSAPDFEDAKDVAHALVDINNDGDEDDPGEAADNIPGNNMYQIIVRATERRASGYMGPAKSSRIGVTVTVQDVNEKGTITLNALQPQIGRGITATLKDGDGVPTVDGWQWRRSNVGSPDIADDDHWEMITTGATAATYTPTMDDEGKYLRVVATYDDTALADPANENTVREVTRYKVRAAPDNNGSPDFAAETHTRLVLETAEVGDPVGAAVTATAADAVDRGKLIYGLVEDTDNSDDDDYFSIDQYTGQIRVAAGLDADERRHTATNPASTDDRNTGAGDAALGNGEYRVVATVGDPSAPAGTPDDTVIVTITATPQNENPTVSGTAGHTIAENANLVADDAMYMASDVDANSNINWDLQGDDKDLLRISGTGDRTLAFIDDPDYEMPGDMNGDNVYEVMVVVTDGQGGQGTRAVRIMVTNIEEDAKVTLSSEQPHLDEPITAMLSDDDIPVLGDVVVAWQWSRSLSSASAAEFTDIPGATSATYTPSARYMYEDPNTPGDTLSDNDTGYFLRATAMYTDDATVDDQDQATTSPDTAMGTSGAAVLATPSVNTAPDFPRAAETRMVNENAPATTAVGDPVVANDPDNEMLEYSMSGADASSFEIDEDSGQITVGMGTMLNHEGTKKTYNVMVTVEDAAGATDSVTVTINVVDMNEMPTMPMQSFGMTITGPSAPEYEEDGMDAIGPYGTQGETGAVTWMALAGDDAGDFTFNRSNGHLMFASTPDYEMPGDMNEDNVYEVTLSATAGLDSDELDVIVTVINKDEMGRVTFWRDDAQGVAQDATDEAIMVGDVLTGLAEDMDGNHGDTLPLSGMYTQIDNVMWQWSKSMTPDMMDSWMPIDGADMAAYEVMSDDAGYYLRATAMYTDGHGSGETAMAMTTGTVTGTVTVTPGDPLPPEFVKFDNGDGAIEEGEVVDAVFEHVTQGRHTEEEIVALVFYFVALPGS